MTIIIPDVRIHQLSSIRRQLASVFCISLWTVALSKGVLANLLGSTVGNSVGVYILPLAFISCAALLIECSRISGAFNVVALLPVLIAAVVDFKHDDLTAATSVSLVCVALVIFGGFIGGGTPRVFSMIGILGALLAVFAIVCGVAVPDRALFGYRNSAFLDKSGVLSNMNPLAAMFDHSNTLGMAMALVFPFALLGSRRRTRLFSATMVVSGLLWSDSRSAMIALLVSLVSVLVFRYAHHDVFLFRGGCIALGLLIVGLPILSNDSSQFSGRGEIWSASLGAVRGSVWLGLGRHWYETGSGEFLAGGATSSGHNLFVSSLVTGGMFYLVSVIVVLILAANSISKVKSARLRLSLEQFFVIFLVISCTEDIWTLSVFDQIFPFGMLIIFMILGIGYQDIQYSRDANQIYQA